MDPSECHLSLDNGADVSQLTAWFLFDSEQEIFSPKFPSSSELSSPFDMAFQEGRCVSDAPTFGYHNKQYHSFAENAGPVAIEVTDEQLTVSHNLPCETSDSWCNDSEHNMHCTPFRCTKDYPDFGVTAREINSVPECARVFPPGFRYNVVTRPTFREYSTDSRYVSSDYEESSRNSSMEFCEADGALHATLPLSNHAVIQQAGSQAQASTADGYGYNFCSSSNQYNGLTTIDKQPTPSLNNTFHFSCSEEKGGPMIDSREHSFNWNINLSYQSPVSSRPVSVCTSPAAPYSPVCGVTQQHDIDETLLPSTSTETETSGTRRPRSSTSESRVSIVGNCCRNGGCGRSLEGAKAYHQRYRLCQACIGNLALNIDGETKRFCQQCSLLHPIAKFDGAKKSCRDRLAVHALRLKRRRQQASRNRQ